MPWFRRWLNVFQSERLNTELEDEFQYHLAETTDRLIAAGMSRKDAFHEARRRIGNYGAQKERTREMNVARWLDETFMDVQYGARQLVSNPGFAAIAILSLALGTGANTTIFQLVNTIRLKTLPVENPAELVSIDFPKESMRAGSWSSRSAVFTYPQWEQLRSRQQAFTGLLAWSAARFNLTDGGEPKYAEGLYVSGDFFRTLGVTPLLGRTFSAQDDSSTCNPGAVLGHAFWQREFAGDPGILGRTVRLDGHTIPIVGVTPPSFFGVEVGSRYDIALPLCADRLMAENHRGRMPDRDAWWLSVIGRLKPGWSVSGATVHLQTISPGIMASTVPAGYSASLAKGYLANRLLAAEAATGISGLRQQYNGSLWLLMATTGLILLISCANLANLLLARASAREPEIALRLAIGASRGRLVRQLLAESLLLAISGAALGAGLAAVLSRVLVRFISTSANPLFVDLAPDWRVLCFTAAVAILTCLLFGLLPAIRATYLAPASAMRSGGRSVTPGRERFGLRRALVATQVALSLVLLFGSFLFVRSLRNLMTVSAGFDVPQVLSVNIDFSRASYPVERRFHVYDELRDRLSALPGVVSVGQISFTPLSGGTWDNLVAPDGAAASVVGRQSFFNQAGPGYFRTMRTRLIAGRDFQNRDTLTAAPVAVVNEAFAKTFFAGANPVGRTFHQGADAGRPEPSFTIVGLVENTKYRDLREDFKPIAYFAIAQSQNPGPSANFVLRTARPPAQSMDDIRAAVDAFSRSLSVEVRPLSAQLQDSLLRDKLMATLSGCFGFLAALLATSGLYGVISYLMARRRNEIGVRIALGAGRASILRLVLAEAVLLLGVGIVSGAGLSLWAAKLASTLLFGLQPYDVVSLTAASGLLLVIALVASYVPASRAAALDPMATLRSD